MALFSETIALLIRADTAGAIAPLKRLEGQAAQTATAWDRAGKKIGVSGAALKGGLAGMVAGGALEAAARGILDVANGYAEAAKAADDLANATGSTIEGVSRMQAALRDAGVTTEKSAAMLTKFATAAGTAKGAETLRALNVEMVRGQSGATDYAATMTAAVDQIGALGDAAQRNTALVALFGRQGAAAFQDLLNSGKSFAEVQKEIASGRLFTAQSGTDAQRYDEAVDSLNGHLEDLRNTLGRDLLPALTAAAEGMGVIAQAAGAVEDALPGDFLTRSLPIPMLALKALGAAFGDDAEAAKELGESIPTTAMQALTAAIAAGATSGAQFADAVAAAGDELAAQESNARLAAQALDVYRASTDQAYEATLNLLSLDAGERSAERAAEGAADAAGDAKANMDKALADANAAKTVVEKIAAIRGRERRKEEDAGIVAGSTDVRAIEGIKGRAAQTKTRVIEAAGVITPAEARQIRDATRAYEQSLDDISAAWIRVGQARVAHLEALGRVLTPAEKLDQIRQALLQGLEIPGLSAESKADIRADLAIVTRQIQALGGVPIEIEGIRFKGGTTEEQIKKLRAGIAAADRGKDRDLSQELRGQLTRLIERGPTDLKATLGLDPESVAATEAALGNLGTNPKTGKPYTAKTIATVDKTQAQKDLDALTKARTMTVTVNYVPGAGGTGAALPTPPYPAAPRLNFGGAAAVTQFSPTIISNYPKPERTSDSIASALRTAKYVVGLS